MNDRPWLSYRLPDAFVARYIDRPVEWGFVDPAGNALGELVYYRTYSRRKSDGAKERWWETCRRVVEGTESILKNHAIASRLPWNEEHAHENACEMYERMFTMRWLPPGRGLWMMGTEFVHAGRDATALQNCSMISTGEVTTDTFAEPFRFLMHASMLGVGVGFDTRGADAKIPLRQPRRSSVPLVVEDSREGWVESTATILRAFTAPGGELRPVDYSLVRPAGSPIAGFGGTASGPEPLRQLHDALCGHLDRYASEGRCVDSRLIVDVANLIGRCVVAGNVRRSAEIALGSPADEDFAGLKDYERPENAERAAWGWVSNNSVLLEGEIDSTIYDRLAERTVENGEPGYVWLDVARECGRLADPPDFADSLAVGVNPCSFAGETLVMTTQGPKRIDSLEGEPFWAIVDGKAHLSPGGSWITGVDDIYRLETVEGYEVALTATHKVMGADGSWYEARDLTPGAEVVIHDHRPLAGWSGRGTEAEGYLLGIFLGDGYFAGGTRHPVALAQLWMMDEGNADVAQEAERHAKTLRHRSDWKGWRRSPCDQRPISMTLGPWVTSYGLARGNKHIGEEIEQTSSEFQRAFLRGLFDTDGHVEGWREIDQQGVSVRLCQSSLSDLRAVQRMLLRLGIKSHIYRSRKEGQALLPDGRGGNRLYRTKECWRLVVSSSDAVVFADRVGFCHTFKSERLAKGLAIHTPYKKPFVARVKSVEFLRRDTVWDLSVSDKHAFDANGLYVSNSEQVLESGELCTLVEIFPTRCNDLSDFHRTIKYAYCYAKAVTLLPTIFPESNAIMARNRRIGCSVSGLAQFVDERSWSELRSWLDSGYGEVRRWDREYSRWLGVRESIRVTSVKPSGSVSLLAGVTPGVHFDVETTMLRAVRLGKDEALVAALRAAGYRVEPAAGSEDTTVVVYLPIRGAGTRTERKASLWEKAELAALAQAAWSDNAVSATLTFDRATEGPQVAKILHAFEGRLKTASFLPIDDSTYQQMPYTRLDEEGYASAGRSLRRLDWKALYDGEGNGGGAGHGGAGGRATADAIGEAYCTTDRCEVPVAAQRR